jgi:hypothetical protein
MDLGNDNSNFEKKFKWPDPVRYLKHFFIILAVLNLLLFVSMFSYISYNRDTGYAKADLILEECLKNCPRDNQPLCEALCYNESQRQGDRKVFIYFAILGISNIIYLLICGILRFLRGKRISGATFIFIGIMIGIFLFGRSLGIW